MSEAVKYFWPIKIVKIILDFFTGFFGLSLIFGLITVLLPFVTLILIVNMFINGGSIDFRTGKKQRKKQALIMKLVKEQAEKTG